MQNTDNLRLAVCITGASGAVYGIDLILKLLENFENAKIFCVATDAAKKISKVELGFDDVENAVSARAQKLGKTLDTSVFGRLKIFGENDFNAPVASGSFYFDAMAISPCSMKTLGKCANSIADNAVVRASDVALKERRRIVFVPRETPLAATHLENMLKLSRAGAVVLPACPAFYLNPKSSDDLVEFVTARTISAMGLKHNITKEWGCGKF